MSRTTSVVPPTSPPGWRRLAFALLIGLAGCQNANGGSTGGETHFLKLCTPEDGSETCGDELSCVCNVCTRPCDADNACSAFPGAACVETGELQGCSDGTAPSLCELECVSDSQCRSLSGEHSCVGGVCRLGPEPGDDQTPTDAAATDVSDGSTSDRCPASDIEANEVLIMGDSFFAASHQITGFVEELAREAGTLSAGDRYRDASRLLNNALAFMGNGILDQYASSVAESPVRVVIMNGGGADALLGDCEIPDASCSLVVDAVMGAEDLLTTMAEDGVADVIYVAYPDPLDSNTKAVLDVMRPLLRDVCEAARTRCHWLDLRPIFEGHYGEYILPDGMNPTAAGAQAVASEIWALMQESCIAQ